MDSIKDFMLAHPNLTFEVHCNTDYRGDLTYNYKLTEVRGRNVIAWLEYNGAKSEQFKNAPQGERKPFLLTPESTFYNRLPQTLQTNENYLLTETFIKQFKEDRKFYELLNKLNRRTVFRIIVVN